MALDPQAKLILEQIEKAGAPPLHTMPPEKARVAYQAMRSTNDVEEVGSVENRQIPGPKGEIPIRIYRPAHSEPVKLPILVFYHGGGWVIGNLDTHDAACRTLTNQANCMVVSVDYRLAPEHKFPAAVEDAFAALEWVANHAEEIGGHREKIAVGGDSAGGNLAAVASILAKEKKSPKLVFQLLIYPSTGAGPTKSFEENGEGYFLTKELMAWFRNHYMNRPEDAKHPYFSPYLYQNASGLPPAFIITAEYDPLRDDGKAYAEKLKNAGVDVQYAEYKGMIHGFVTMASVIDKGKTALQDAAAALKKAFQ